MSTSSVTWRKSLRSGNNGGDCVEVAVAPGNTAGVPNKAGEDLVVLVRDSKNPHIAPHAFTVSEWDAFLADAKEGRFDMVALAADLRPAATV